MSKKSHALISPTAIDIAFVRSYSGIPYAREIFELLENKKGGFASYSQKTSLDDYSGIPKRLLPYFEARYKTLDWIITKSKVKNVLEIAAGLSPRGLNMAKNKKIHYVETDLADMMGFKKKIAQKILKRKGVKRDNLHFLVVDALDGKKLLKAASIFKAGPVAVINEGLLRYLSLIEKEILAKNIHAILKKYGGFWATPDIRLKSDIRDVKRSLEISKRHSKVTGTDIFENMFLDMEDAISFFNRMGFRVEVCKLIDFKKLTLPKRLGISKREYAEERVSSRVTFKMTVK